MVLLSWEGLRALSRAIQVAAELYQNGEKLDSEAVEPRLGPVTEHTVSHAQDQSNSTAVDGPAGCCAESAARSVGGTDSSDITQRDGSGGGLR